MIKLSQTGYYALHAVLYIAAQKEMVKIKDIAIKEGISESLLRRIIAGLEKAHIIESTRGRNGGVTLAKEIHKITVYDVLEASGEELGIRDCTKGLACDNKNFCIVF